MTPSPPPSRKALRLDNGNDHGNCDLLLSVPLYRALRANVTGHASSMQVVFSCSLTVHHYNLVPLLFGTTIPTSFNILYRDSDSTTLAVTWQSRTVAEKGHPILPFHADFHPSILLFCYFHPSILPFCYFHPSILLSFHASILPSFHIMIIAHAHIH